MEKIKQTNEEKLQAINKLKQRLETDFVELGQILSEVKIAKLYKIKDYRNFSEFIENEYQLGAALANKLIRVYRLYFDKLQIDETTIKAIGIDKLNILASQLKDLEPQEAEELINKAVKMPISEIRETGKKDKTPKEILVDQWLDRMTSFFGCSQKEVKFKLALYFQDRSLEEIRNEISEKQLKFEQGAL